MDFVKITDNDSLFAVIYDGDENNILYQLFENWNDVEFLRKYFLINISNLSYYGIPTVDKAIQRTINDSDYFENILLDVNSSTDLDSIFEAIGEIERAQCILVKCKAKRKKEIPYQSWLRVYAVKIDTGCYIITGGAIKLTRTMQEDELFKLEKCKNYLKSNGVFDKTSFTDFLNNN